MRKTIRILAAVIAVLGLSWFLFQRRERSQPPFTAAPPDKPAPMQQPGSQFTSYIMAVASKEERSAAAGITGVARTTGAAISPLFVGFMFARPSWINVPFFIAGTLKILYDLLLYREFVAIRPPEER
jgi:hypothetical protein